MSGTFIISTGRCGSTALTEALNSHTSLLGLSEFFVAMQPEAFRPGELDGPELERVLCAPRPLAAFMFRHGLFTREMRCDPNDVRLGEQGCPPLMITTLPSCTARPEDLHESLRTWCRSCPPAPLASHYRDVFDWLCTQTRASWWFERSGGSASFTSALVEFFPGARFLHLYRSGRECIQSMSRHHAYRLAAIDYLFHRHCGVRPFAAFGARPVRPVPDWLARLHPLHFSRSYYDEFEIPAETFATLWTAAILAATRELRSLPAERVLNIRYEDLVECPRRKLSRAFSFVTQGTEADEGWLESAARALSTFEHGDRHPMPLSVRARRVLRVGNDALAALVPDDS